MRLTALCSLLNEMASWDWNMLAHAAEAPTRTHPNGLETARKACVKLIDLARAEGDTELETETLECLARIQRSQNAKADKAEDQEEA